MSKVIICGKFSPAAAPPAAAKNRKGNGEGNLFGDLTIIYI